MVHSDAAIEEPRPVLAIHVPSVIPSVQRAVLREARVVDVLALAHMAVEVEPPMWLVKFLLLELPAKRENFPPESIDAKAERQVDHRFSVLQVQPAIHR